MAELTQLEEKIGEVLGLARASQDATGKVAGLVEDESVKQTLQQMGAEAKETDDRLMRVVEQLDGKKTAIQEKAQETKNEASEMMKTYLGGEEEGLEGLEFLIMAEAGELGHIEIVRKMNEQVGNSQLGEVADWALEVQSRHFDQVRQAALTIAGQEDANEVE